MKVLFIGGTGVISSACAEDCIQNGIDLTVLVRGTRNDRLVRGAHVIEGDLKQDTSNFNAQLNDQSWDAVVDWTIFEEQDAKRSFTLFKGKTERFFFISTTSVYRKPLGTSSINETTSIGNTLWPYAEKKGLCEIFFLDRFKTANFPIVIIRPGHCYAEFTCPTGFQGLGFGIVERIINRKDVLLHDKGTGLWTLTHSIDFSRALTGLLKSKVRMEGEIFQITSDERITWNQIYQTIGQEAGCEVRLKYATSKMIDQFDKEVGQTLLGDRAHSYLFDNNKIKQWVPGFSCKISFQEGIRGCLDWYQKNKGKAIVDKSKEILMDRILKEVEV